ncbi:hypothetical protein C8R46DRAFT_1114704 [Mycena filopes]|nr:hypothetical protein C8R46DRAFT_1114704 [Mycena filopes]
MCTQPSHFDASSGKHDTSSTPQPLLRAPSSFPHSNLPRLSSTSIQPRSPRPLLSNPPSSPYFQRVAHLRKPHSTYIPFPLLPHPTSALLPPVYPSLPTSPPLPSVAIRPQSLFVAYRPRTSCPPRYHRGSPRSRDYPPVRVAMHRIHRLPPSPPADWLRSLTIVPVVARPSDDFHHYPRVTNTTLALRQRNTLTPESRCPHSLRAPQRRGRCEPRAFQSRP